MVNNTRRNKYSSGGNLMDDLNNGQELHQIIFRKASIWQRLGAFLIDHSILSYIFAFVFVIVFVSGLVASGDSYEPPILLFAFALLPVFLVYCFRDIVKGQSIGKRLLGIGVRDINDKFAVPPASRLFLRQIFSFIWPVEFLVLIFSGENRKIGDKIAGTEVYDLREYDKFVRYNKHTGSIIQTQAPESLKNAESRPHIEQYKPQKTKTTKIIIGVVLAVTIFVGTIAFGITSMFRNHPAYHVAKDSIRANTDIVILIGEVESFGFRPSGTIGACSGHGDARLNIRAKGTHGEVRVFVELQMRDGGDWEIVRFNFVQIR